MLAQEGALQTANGQSQTSEGTQPTDESRRSMGSEDEEMARPLRAKVATLSEASCPTSTPSSKFTETRRRGGPDRSTTGT